MSEENSIWYRVRLTDDSSGWISKQIAVKFDDAKSAEIYQKILAKYSKSKMAKTKPSIRAATDISDRAEFNRLLTELRQIISKVPFVEKAKAIQQINQIGEGCR